MKAAFLKTIEGKSARLTSTRGRFVGHGEIIALGCLIVMVSAINMVWIGQDTRPQAGADPNHYLIKTFEFVDRLREGGSDRLWGSVSGMSLQGRPQRFSS